MVANYNELLLIPREVANHECLLVHERLLNTSGCEDHSWQCFLKVDIDGMGKRKLPRVPVH